MTAEQSFKHIFDKEYNNLCRYALAYMQDIHLAEDVVQDTFIKIWEQKKELLNTAHIKYYLITSVKNNCITALRKRQVTPEKYMETIVDADHDIHITTREHYENMSQQQKKIADALEQLPPKCKEIFLLIKLHGLSYKEAASVLDLSVKTIENQMGKAIKIFKEYSSAIILLLMKIFLTKNI